MANIQHASIPEAQLHEAKGASTSTTGQVLTSTGGAATFQTPSTAPAAGTLSQGVYDYNDLATATTPIPLTSAATRYKLTNDTLGPFTNTTYSLPGLDDVWVDGVVSQFTWVDGTQLSLGDTVDIRFDVEYNTGQNNTEISLDLDMAVGSGAPYTLSVIDNLNIATSGTTKELIEFSIYMGDTNTLNFPSEVMAKASKTGTTVKVNGWFVRVIHTNA